MREDLSLSSLRPMDESPSRDVNPPPTPSTDSGSGSAPASQGSPEIGVNAPASAQAQAAVPNGPSVPPPRLPQSQAQSQSAQNPIAEPVRPSPGALPSMAWPPPPPPPPSAAAPQKSRTGGWIWALLFLSLLGAAVILALGFFVDRLNIGRVARMSGTTSGRPDHLRETVLESANTRDKIAVIDLNGVISSDPWDYQGNNLITFIEEQLDRAAADSHVKAVILKVDSPGGEVLASDEIYKLILDFQEHHEKPVVASMGTVAASGGYYVSAPCRWIVANDLTITGSIGVIMQSYNWRGLLDKVGVRPQVFKSGELKDMLSPDKQPGEITEEERRIVQDLVNETFERFKSVIEEGRGFAKAHNEDNAGDEADKGRPLSKSWSDYADGRLLSGKEAWKLGLVDELGDFSAAVERAQKLSGIDDAKLIQYLRPVGFGSLFRLFGQSEETRIKIDLGIQLPQLRAGLYFLAPQLMR
ncbi:MAG: signal peptide peptidase SppA [Verrucomicrobiales bacterium]|nr:signal peptide peptidase SppA [Verrucomicrobiales bacterium]